MTNQKLHDDRCKICGARSYRIYCQDCAVPVSPMAQFNPDGSIKHCKHGAAEQRSVESRAISPGEVRAADLREVCQRLKAAAARAENNCDQAEDRGDIESCANWSGRVTAFSIAASWIEALLPEPDSDAPNPNPSESP